MKIILIYVSFIVSNILLISNHPIMLVIMILIQTMILSLSVFVMLSMSWFSLMMFLIYIGGLMVLFVYITSLASNEKFNLNYSVVATPMILSLIMFFTHMNLSETLTQMFEFNQIEIMIYKIFNNSVKYPTLITMIYLLLTLLITVDIIKLYNAPMRSIL